MRPLPIIIILTIVVFLLGGAIFLSSLSSSNSKNDSFAQCLSGKGIAMYGTYSCSHCQNTKKMFGSSFRYINYVECTTKTQLCIDKNIEAYPTWIFSDSSREVGEITLEKLSSISGCQLPD
jgi:hypothetical protein